MREYKDYEDEINELAIDVEEFISRHAGHPQSKMVAIGSRVREIARDMLNLTFPIADDNPLYYSTVCTIEHRILSLVIYRSFRPSKRL